jgi:hypothetical protein
MALPLPIVLLTVPRVLLPRGGVRPLVVEDLVYVSIKEFYTVQSKWTTIGMSRGLIGISLTGLLNNALFAAVRPGPYVPADGDKVTMRRRLADAKEFEDRLTKIIWWKVGRVIGDPHIKTWNGTWYDWHGGCDSVLLDAPNFGNGAGLLIHTRTKIRYDYSYIENAAIQIGGDILEVASFGEYKLNGISRVHMPTGVSDYFVTHKRPNKLDHEFVIDLGQGASLLIKTHKDIVSVTILGAAGEGYDFDKWFTNSKGLMGSYETGEMLARDGVTVLNDPNAFGQEWQVRDRYEKASELTESSGNALQCMLMLPC